MVMGDYYGLGRLIMESLPALVTSVLGGAGFTAIVPAILAIILVEAMGGYVRVG